MEATMKDNKKVSFDAVQIREYPIVPSDNPASTSYGPAVEIGWSWRMASEIRSPVGQGINTETHKVDGKHVSVQEYEQIRPSGRRRSIQSLYMVPPQREYYVKQSNYTDAEVEEYMKEKERIIKSRNRTNSLRNPVVAYREGVASNRRTKKVKRAVRNLRKEEKPTDPYDGWWYPFSAHLF